MGLINQIREDVKKIVSDSNDFGVAIKFVAPNLLEANVIGFHSKLTFEFNTSGEKVNTREAYVSVAEIDLVDVGYPVRNADGKVDLKRHKVTVADSTGEDYTYEISEWIPDETVGLIVCQLKDFK